MLSKKQSREYLIFVTFTTVIFITVIPSVSFAEVRIETKKEREKREVLEPRSFEEFSTSESIKKGLLSPSDVLKFSHGVDILDMGWKGSTKSALIRGSRAEGTLLSLDGVFLNNVQNGLPDISLVSNSAVERLRIVKTPGAYSGFQSTGGMIDLKTPNFNSPTKDSFEADFGSFGFFRTYVNTLKKNRNLLAFVSGGLERADNNFEYSSELFDYGTGTGTRRRKNTEFTSVSFLAKGELKGDIKASTLFLAKYSKKGASSDIYSEDSYESAKLEDVSILSYANISPFTFLRLDKFAFRVSEVLNISKYKFRSENIFLSSRTELSSFFNFGIKSVESKTSATLFFENADFSGVRAYGNRSRLVGNINISSFYSAFVDFPLIVDVETGLTSAQKVEGINKNSNNIFPSFKGGISFGSRTARLFTSSGYGSRLPTFNEIFWQTIYGLPPAILTPENCWMWEVGTKYFPISKITFETVLWYKLYLNRIEWRPGFPNFVWVPENIGKAKIFGTEISLYYKTETLRSRGVFEYSQGFDEKNKLIPYRPIFGYLLSLEFGKTIYPFLRLKGIGKRFTNRENTAFLPLKGFSDNILDAGIGAQIKTNTALVSSFIVIENILDHSYETIPGFPMPKRSLTGGIMIEL